MNNSVNNDSHFNPVDLPHEGWTYLEFEDLGDMTGRCQYCGSRIRYVHYIAHPQFGTIAVGHTHCDLLLNNHRATRRESAHKKRLSTFNSHFAPDSVPLDNQDLHLTGQFMGVNYIIDGKDSNRSFSVTIGDELWSEQVKSVREAMLIIFNMLYKDSPWARLHKDKNESTQQYLDRLFTETVLLMEQETFYQFPDYNSAFLSRHFPKVRIQKVVTTTYHDLPCIQCSYLQLATPKDILIFISFHQTLTPDIYQSLRNDKILSMEIRLKSLVEDKFVVYENLHRLMCDTLANRTWIYHPLSEQDAQIRQQKLQALLQETQQQEAERKAKQEAERKAKQEAERKPIPSPAAPAREPYPTSAYPIGCRVTHLTLGQGQVSETFLQGGSPRVSVTFDNGITRDFRIDTSLISRI